MGVMGIFLIIVGNAGFIPSTPINPKPLNPKPRISPINRMSLRSPAPGRRCPDARSAPRSCRVRRCRRSRAARLRDHLRELRMGTPCFRSFLGVGFISLGFMVKCFKTLRGTCTRRVRPGGYLRLNIYCAPHAEAKAFAELV